MMKFSLTASFLVFFILSAGYMQLLSSNKVKSKYFQFSNQLEPLSTKATNFALLESVDLGELSSSTFTICGSIYIRFYRGYPAFYTLRKNDQKTLWFSLFIETQDTISEAYQPGVAFHGGVVTSNTGNKLRLRPHAWSHACTTVDAESGHVTVVINGILTHNTTISNKDFAGNVPTVFQYNLVLGVQEDKFIKPVVRQSEPSVRNVNVFSVSMNQTQMEKITTTGQWPEGDIVSWSEAIWTISGSVGQITSDKQEHLSNFPNLFKMANGFHSAHDCMNLCPRIQAGGRLPLTKSAAEAELLAQLFYHPDNTEFFWSPFIYQSEGNFTDYYTGTAMPENLWMVGQPNGGQEMQCTEWDGNNPKGNLFDMSCYYSGQKLQCLCQFEGSTLLRMRGKQH